MISNISPKIGDNRNFLNKIFNSFISNKFSPHSTVKIEDFELYNIILKLLRDNKLNIIVDEIKYRITDGEELNDVFIDVIENNNVPLEIKMCLTNLYDIENNNWIKKFS